MLENKIRGVLGIFSGQTDIEPWVLRRKIEGIKFKRLKILKCGLKDELKSFHNLLHGCIDVKLFLAIVM